MAITDPIQQDSIHALSLSLQVLICPLLDINIPFTNGPEHLEACPKTQWVGFLTLSGKVLSKGK